MTITYGSNGTQDAVWITLPESAQPPCSPGPLFDAGVAAAWAVANPKIAELEAERDAYRRDAERLREELDEARKELLKVRR